MSGGAFNYLYNSIEDIANDMEDLEIIELTKDFAKLVHDAEWYHSADIGKGNYMKSVKEFKEKWLSKGTQRNNDLINAKINELREELISAFGAKKYCKDCVNCTPVENSSYFNCEHVDCCMMHLYDDTCDKFEERKSNG